MPEKEADRTEARECPVLTQKDAEVVSSGDGSGIIEQSKKRLGWQPVLRVAEYAGMEAASAEHRIGIQPKVPRNLGVVRQYGCPGACLHRPSRNAP